MTVILSSLQQTLINRYQKGFPLTAEPFKQLAEELNCTEAEIVEAFSQLGDWDILSRIGPVFDHKKAGASTLAALAVPEHQLDEVAAIINRFDEVNHNYARQHSYNLWFVVTASSPVALNQTLTQIEQQTGFPILILPMEASYHIDLSFHVTFDDETQRRDTDCTRRRTL